MLAVTPTPDRSDQRNAAGASARGGPLPLSINGAGIDQILVMPDAVRQNLRLIFAKGISLGRNPHAFAKVGDSTMVWPPFLTVFDSPGRYKLGAYAGLQPAIDYLADSFSRPSIAVQKNMHSWGQFDISLADYTVCDAAEGPLACELRLWNPSVVIIRLGVNDALVPDALDKNLRRIIEYCTERGIVPVLGTKPDRLEGPDNTINKLIERVATAYNIPLWDYDLVAATVPGKGLDKDNMHFLNGGLRDYSSAATLQTADALEDLTGLMMLNAIYREVQAIQ